MCTNLSNCSYLQKKPLYFCVVILVVNDMQNLQEIRNFDKMHVKVCLFATFYDAKRIDNCNKLRAKF